MHSKYFFMIDLPNDWKTNSPIDVREWVQNEFQSRYGDEKCDENNFYTIVALILPDGRTIPICKVGDYRGRDTWSHYIVRMPRTTRRAWARKFAMGCAEYELNLTWDTDHIPGYQLAPEDENWSDFKGRDKAIRKMTRNNLKAIKEVIKQNAEDKHLERLKRSTSLTFSLYKSAEYTPFAKKLSSPYAYRNYDLRIREAKPEECAILMVDIHT